MEETIPTPPAPAAPTPPTPPVPPAPAAPAPAAPAQPAFTPPASSGGGDNIIDSLKSLNWLEIGFGVLGAAALYFTIYYYRYNMIATKSSLDGMQNKVDDLTMKVSDLGSELAASKSSSPSQQLFT